MQEPATPPVLPDPDIVKSRQPSVNPPMPRLPRNSFPRLTIDSQGTVYISYRSREPWQSPLASLRLPGRKNSGLQRIHFSFVAFPSTSGVHFVPSGDVS